MDQQIIEKAKEVGMLLAQSPLSDDIKQVFLDAIDTMKVSDLDLLLDSLRKEDRELELFAEKLEQFFKERDQDWKNLEAEQKKRTTELVEEFLRDIQK